VVVVFTSANYTNYIYLFDNPNSIRATAAASLDDVDAVLGEDFKNVTAVSALIELVAPNQVKYQVFGPDSFDFPSSLQSIERTETENGFVENSSANINKLDIDLKVSSNDPGDDPRQRNIFVFDNKTIEYRNIKVTGEYRLNIPDNTTYSLNVFFKKIMPTSVDAQKKFDLDYDLKKTNSKFVYTSKDYVTADFNQVLPLFNTAIGLANDETFEATVNSKIFQPYFDNLQTLDGQGVQFNAATKYGVPYDFKTDLKENINNKSLGVKTAVQPTYDKIYNYYDPQYEPVSIGIIENFIVDEKSLPSIYDFLFLETQKESIRTFLGLPSFDIEDITLSNLNDYLDNYSQLYEKYLIEDSPIETIQSVKEKYFVTDDGLIGAKTISPTDDTLGQLAPKNEAANVNDVSKQNFMLLLENDKQNFPLQLINDKSQTVPRWIQQMKTGIYFSEKSIDIFNQALDKNNIFPYLVKINIPNETKGPIAKLFSKNNLLDGVNTYAASVTIPNITSENNVTEDSQKTFAKFYGALINGVDTTNYNIYSGVNLPTFKLYFRDQFLPQANINPDLMPITPSYDSDVFLDTMAFKFSNTSKNLFVYKDADDNMNIEGELADLIQKLKIEVYNKQLEELLLEEKLLRSPYDINTGKLAHQETLMYEIAKYKIDSDGVERYLQSIFLPITEKENTSYYDTQIIPYKNYFYKIFAHKVVVGTEYKMIKDTPEENKAVTLLNFVPPYVASDESKKHFRLRYQVAPYMQFVRVPYYNTKEVNIETDELNYTRVEDSPPLPPQVNAIPYRNVNDKILFLFGLSTGELQQIPKPIFANDEEVFKLASITQDVEYGKKITFKSDDSIGSYEVYRVLNAPASYSDFQTDASLTSYILEQGNTSLQDTIIPNVDYYYTFRFRDIHDKLSNPSSIYKIKIVQNIGVAPYTKIEVYDIEDTIKKQNNEKFSSFKNFEKYLLIQPSQLQNTVRYDNLEINQETGTGTGNFISTKVELGDPSGNTVFGKKYKLRITSKQTGKKIDINFTVKTPKNIINDL